MYRSIIERHQLQLHGDDCCTGVAQRVFLSSNTTTPCFGDTVDLICSYPDVTERVNGVYKYTATIPNWRKNGEILYPDEDAFDQDHINMTATRLRVRIDPAIFTGDPVSFTCFLPLTGGGEDRGSTEVDAQGMLHAAFILGLITYLYIVHISIATCVIIIYSYSNIYAHIEYFNACDMNLFDRASIATITVYICTVLIANCQLLLYTSIRIQNCFM